MTDLEAMMQQADENFGDVIRAAGGLVWRESPDGGKQLAVILRKRYSGEGWTLPKGKLDPEKGDKTWEGAARREVGEEIGIEVEVTSFVGCNSYVDKEKNKPKVVLYWNMSVTAKAQPTDSGEVKEVRWMTTQEALAHLHYAGERTLLWASIEGLDCPPICASQVNKRWWRSTSWNRLASSLPPYCSELEHLISQTQKPESPWVSAARCLLNETTKALKAGNDELGWKCFLAAQRIELFGLSEDALQVRARSILTEGTQKLEGWRKKNVVDLLAQKPAPEPDCVVPKSNITVAEALEASVILHEHFSNVQLRLRFYRRLLGALASIALTAVGIWNIVAWPVGFNVAGTRLLASVMLFGVMGASFSGTLSLSRGVSKARIPEQIATIAITLARQAAGMVSALAVYFFLTSGLLSFKDGHDPHLILALSFAAGFSERLVVRAVETLP